MVVIGLGYVVSVALSMIIKDVWIIRLVQSDATSSQSTDSRPTLCVERGAR